MVKEYTKQVMHNAIVHHLLADAQLVPKQWATNPPANSSQVLLFSGIPDGMEYLFGQFGPAVLAVSPLKFLCLQLLAGRAA